MLMAMALTISQPVNAVLVSCLPWSLLKIFGQAYILRFCLGQ
jgi:hypothetical protein